MESQQNKKIGEVKIEMKHHLFNPEKIEIGKGTKVEWHNDDLAPHTVTSDPDGKKFDSGIVLPLLNYSHTFDTPGTYPYHCTVHKGMKGTIIVK